MTGFDNIEAPCSPQYTYKEMDSRDFFVFRPQIMDMNGMNKTAGTTFTTPQSFRFSFGNSIFTRCGPRTFLMTEK